MTDRSKFLYEELQKREGNPSQLRDYNLWDGAMDGMAEASNTINRVVEWLRDTNARPEPNLFEMFSNWARSKEYLAMLNNHQPVIFSEEQGKALDLYTVEQIDNELLDLDGLMEGAEDYNPTDYQALINRQLTERLEKWIAAVSQPYAEMSPEDDDVWDLCEERDELEFARAGLNVIRMQNNLDTGKPRLPDVEYDRFRTKLREMDVVFRKIIESEKREGRTYKDVNTPSIFWWRH